MLINIETLLIGNKLKDKQDLILIVTKESSSKVRIIIN
jgi:hypothetical protein